MEKRSNNFEFDFTPVGQAIKQAREARGMTREAVSEIVDYVPRHIQAIENEGQVPSVELLANLPRCSTYPLTNTYSRTSRPPQARFAGG